MLGLLAVKATQPLVQRSELELFPGFTSLVLVRTKTILCFCHTSLRRGEARETFSSLQECCEQLRSH